jgi:metal-dependent hydrolase (beta-lactamase superfamily II)
MCEVAKATLMAGLFFLAVSVQAEPTSTSEDLTMTILFDTGADAGTLSSNMQALAVRVRGGVAVVTGCAHPGVARMVQVAHDELGGPIRLVMGGFHMSGASRRAVSLFRGSHQVDLQRNVRRAVHCGRSRRAHRVVSGRPESTG